jgi:hypothetical protein
MSRTRGGAPLRINRILAAKNNDGCAMKTERVGARVFVHKTHLAVSCGRFFADIWSGELREPGSQHSATIQRLAEPVNQRPMGTLIGRFLDGNDDEIAVGRCRNDVGGGEMTFLPAIWLFH